MTSFTLKRRQKLGAHSTRGCNSTARWIKKRAQHSSWTPVRTTQSFNRARTIRWERDVTLEKNRFSGEKEKVGGGHDWTRNGLGSITVFMSGTWNPVYWIFSGPLVQTENETVVSLWWIRPSNTGQLQRQYHSIQGPNTTVYQTATVDKYWPSFLFSLCHTSARSYFPIQNTLLTYSNSRVLVPRLILFHAWNRLEYVISTNKTSEPFFGGSRLQDIYNFKYSVRLCNPIWPRCLYLYDPSSLTQFQ